MLPLIAAGVGVFALAGYLYSQKSSCSRCNSKVTLNEECGFCKKPVCSVCGEQLEAFTHRGYTILRAGRYCKTHSTEIVSAVKAKVAELDAEAERQEAYAKKRAAAEQRVGQVEIYPKTFKGHLNLPTHGKKLTTAFFRDQAEARRELAIMALMIDMDCRVVQQVELVDEQQMDDNYIFRVWSATGVI